jgi:endoglucanase
MKDSIRQALEALTALDGPSGFEQAVVAYLDDHLAAAGGQTQVDAMGNLYAALGAEQAAPHVMIAAHSDEIGAIVRHVDERGFLRIDPLGGVSPVLLVGRRVRVAGHMGVVGTRPGHLLSPEERRQAPPIDQLYVDVGADSAEEAAALGIRVGTPLTYDAPLQAYGNPDRLSGKAIDNRLGCAILLQLFRELAAAPFMGRLTGLVAVQEEVGLRGAAVAARRVQPDFAIVVDTLPVGDTPDVPPGRMPGRIAHGPVLVVAAGGSVEGHIGHPQLNARLEAAAQEVGVPLQRATSIGYAVTDAAAIHLQGRGIPTAVLGLPRRYSHSPVCTFDINDAVGAVRVLEQFVRGMAGQPPLSFL